MDFRGLSATGNVDDPFKGHCQSREIQAAANLFQGLGFLHRFHDVRKRGGQDRLHHLGAQVLTGQEMMHPGAAELHYFIVSLVCGFSQFVL